jgi:hypothetical protein
MPFTAKYNGVCGACVERIHDGDLVQYTADHELVHVDCDTAIPVRRSAVVCPDCWTEKPCGCDD